MRLFQRLDAPLVVGLTAALVIIFATPISRLLDYAREMERKSCLTLVPALVVLTVVFLLHLVRSRHEVQARAAAAEAARREAERRTAELERLVVFGHAIARDLDHNAIRAAVVQHVPRMAGTDEVWLLLRHGRQWETLTGDAHGEAELVAREAFAERILEGTEDSVAEEHNLGFPLVVGGNAVGVLGVRTNGPVDDDRRRAIEAAAALVAVSLKNVQLFREVRESGLRDALTGCWTRAHAFEVIDSELRRARRTQLAMSVILFDIDRFKEVNDRVGHRCGDSVLTAVGRRMRDVLRSSDLKCRYGGEEFLVVLPETSLNGAGRVAETLRREIAERPIPWAGEALAITASFGVTQAMPGESSIDAIIGRADAALYQAKRDGRNCVRVTSQTMAAVSELRATR